LPVVDRNKRLVGILSLGDLATSERTLDEAGTALSGVSQQNEDAGSSKPKGDSGARSRRPS
jgi:hypothetical protein